MSNHHRREKFTPQLMLVNLPEEGYEDTHEGGLAFYFIIKSLDFEHDRCCCIPGESFLWLRPDSCLTHGMMDKKVIDGGLLIGSTGQSLWDGSEYFKARYKDLNEKGKQLYGLLKELYGEVLIVTKLDT